MKIRIILPALLAAALLILAAFAAGMETLHFTCKHIFFIRPGRTVHAIGRY